MLGVSFFNSCFLENVLFLICLKTSSANDILHSRFLGCFEIRCRQLSSHSRRCGEIIIMIRLVGLVVVLKIPIAVVAVSAVVVVWLAMLLLLLVLVVAWLVKRGVLGRLPLLWRLQGLS